MHFWVIPSLAFSMPNSVILHYHSIFPVQMYKWSWNTWIYSINQLWVSCKHLSWNKSGKAFLDHLWQPPHKNTEVWVQYGSVYICMFECWYKCVFVLTVCTYHHKMYKSLWTSLIDFSSFFAMICVCFVGTCVCLYLCVFECIWTRVNMCNVKSVCMDM